ncbi:MAG: NADH-quinone oxidoreductase subunit A [Chitinophagales bacterium]|nr:NADH-quinone oxidoreductase subunit A [Chitinophagales bacterium]
MNSTYTTLWPFLVYGIAVVLLAAFMLVASHFLGERHKEKATDEVFESGIEATGTARVLFPIHFYLIAMFFVIFDLEAVFVVSWAIAVKAIGWAGYFIVLFFIAILIAVLIYEWRIGALDFGPSGKKILKAYHQRIKESREKKTSEANMNTAASTSE